MTQESVRRPSITVTLVAVFAALYVVLSILPSFPVLGLPEMEIHLEASIASVFGMLLGPYLGALAAFIGTIAAFFYGGASPFDLPFIFNPAFNALIVGLIFRNKWKSAFALFAVVIAAFWLTPVSNPINENQLMIMAATFDKIVALLLIVPVAMMLKTGGLKLEKAEPKLLGISFTVVFLASFVGNQADSALGVLLFAVPPVYEGIFQLNLEITRSLYVISPLVYPALRILQAFIAMWIGLPLIKALKTLKVQVWP